MNLFAGQIFALFLLFVVFTPLERTFALHKDKKVFRKGFATDVLHILFNRFIVDLAGFLVIVTLAVSMTLYSSQLLRDLVASQPIWLQFIEAVATANIFGYFAHRLTHSVPLLWRFHAIHHSSENLDWLAAARTHPIDQIFSRAMIFVPLFLLGFTQEVFGAYLIVAVLHGVFLHSNVRFKFKFLRGIVATPHYHHWHHSNHPEAANKNFAGQFPILDLLFGTYYFPEEKTPHIYGVNERIPRGYLGQLKYPFSAGTQSGS
ncbi:MAG: sterol desaturase family protein [Acidobacteriota bacterium]|nr:sterol desaturase family protein [Acidobacteriota bacterium]MDH3530457.1 sterol desaturase family protein [Acidobacteriota bacterium]